jgi:hypothetical protein
MTAPVGSYFGYKYIVNEMKRLGMRQHTTHARRYLNQFVANGTASKKAGCYRIKNRYINRTEPKSRVKVKSEINRIRNDA